MPAPELATYTSSANDAFVPVADAVISNSVNVRGLYVGTTGNVSLLMNSGVTAVWKNVPAGFVIPARFTKVLAASTAPVADMLVLS